MQGSIQDNLTRIRPPRVKITYDVETAGALEKKELPFIVGILADLGGDTASTAPLKDRKLVEIDRDNFNQVLEKIGPTLNLGAIDNKMTGTGKLGGALAFKSMDDFSPVKVIGQIADMKSVYEARGRLRFLQSKAEIADVLAKYLDTLSNNAADGDPKAARDDLATAYTGKATVDKWKEATVTADKPLAKVIAALGLKDAAKDTFLTLLGQFKQDVIDPRFPAQPDPAVAAENPSKGFAALIDAKVAAIDVKLGGQLDAVFHEEKFQKLEATWRGLNYLVFRTETGAMLKLRVLNASKQDLLDDLTKAVEFDQSGLFKMIYEAEYGTYGGMPFSMLVGDYYFGRNHQDAILLQKLAEVAAASHAPFVAAADEALFDLKSFENLARPRDLAKIFESLELVEWRSFRESEDSRYVTLTLPKVLLRLPYDPVNNPCEGVSYKEGVFGAAAGTPDTTRFLWGNAAFILAQRVTNAFALYSWTAAIRGVEGGGLVENLPVYTYTSDDGDMAMICPTQVAITDRREKELNDLGFMAICHCKGLNKAAFFGGQTTNSPKKYLTDLANSNAAISAMLPYMLAASRFAHYVKVIMRDKIGSFLTRANVEAYLNNWISQYVLLDENAAQVVKAAYPLSAAKIVVTEMAGKPGSYNATIFLRPHFQLEELTTSIRLVAKLPA